MTTTRSHLIRRRRGVIRVLRLVCQGRRAWPLTYDVHPDEEMCSACGCTNVFGCAGGCSWVDAAHTLCSRCLAKELLL